MLAGKLRHRISFIEPQDGAPNIAGQVISVDQHSAPRWARFEPLEGRELYNARQVAADVTHAATVRFDKEIKITPRTRIKHLDSGRIFHIRAPLNIQERNKEVQILCTEVV